MFLSAACTDDRARRPPLPASEQPAFVPAYPQSSVIAGVTFDDASARTEAVGSDIWPITWAADGNLYTAWGDGGGLGELPAQLPIEIGAALDATSSRMAPRYEGTPSDEALRVGIVPTVGVPSDDDEVPADPAVSAHRWKRTVLR